MILNTLETLTKDYQGAVLFVLLSVVVAMLAAFCILFISKIGLRDMVVMEAPKLLSRLFDCDFCLSWWTCLFISIGMALAARDLSILVTALIATPITRRMVL